MQHMRRTARLLRDTEGDREPAWRHGEHLPAVRLASELRRRERKEAQVHELLGNPGRRNGSWPIGWRECRVQAIAA